MDAYKYRRSSLRHRLSVAVIIVTLCIAFNLFQSAANASVSQVNQAQQTVAQQVESQGPGNFLDHLEAKIESNTSARQQGLNALWVKIGLLALGALLSEDLTCIIGGILASKGILPLWAAFIGCGVGIFLGDIFLYFLGYFFGKSALDRPPLKWLVKPKQIEKIANWYHRRGGIIILASRFLPGTRIPAYVAAGVLRIPVGLVIFYYFIAVALWTPVLVSLSYLLGNTIIVLFAHYEQDAMLSVIAVILCYWIIIHLMLPLLYKKQRRILLGKIRRLQWWRK